MNAALTHRDLRPVCPLRIAERLTLERSRLLARSLAIFRHRASVRRVHDDPRIVPVQLTAPNKRTRYEIWTTERPRHTDVSEGIRYADDGLLLSGWLTIPELHLEDLEESTCRAYGAILRLLHRLQFPHLLRVWNYLSDINDGVGDRERYRRFTVGRYRALARAPGFERQLPAATTIGTLPHSGLGISFLASRVPGIQLENPRQTSAFHYPRVYGPKTPSFSRAVLQHWRDRSLLFVSGTASIVGHETHHPDDAAAQFDEVIRNLDALLEHAAREHFPGDSEGSFEPLAYRLYARDDKALRTIGAQRCAALTSRSSTLVLYGDLCRRDLLVEVEGVFEWRARRPFPTGERLTTRGLQILGRRR